MIKDVFSQKWLNYTFSHYLTSELLLQRLIPIVTFSPYFDNNQDLQISSYVKLQRWHLRNVFTKLKRSLKTGHIYSFEEIWPLQNPIYCKIPWLHRCSRKSVNIFLLIHWMRFDTAVKKVLTTAIHVAER